MLTMGYTTKRGRLDRTTPIDAQKLKMYGSGCSRGTMQGVGEAREPYTAWDEYQHGANRDLWAICTHISSLDRLKFGENAKGAIPNG